MNWKEIEADEIAGDTKAGTLIAKDRYGNKYYENLQDELPCMMSQAILSSTWELTITQCVQDGWIIRRRNSIRKFILQNG